MKKRKILGKVIAGSRNIRFDELVSLLIALGFTLERTEGSHYTFAHPKVSRPLPIQSIRGKAKPYQVRQLLKLIEQYDLQLEDEFEDE